MNAEVRYQRLRWVAAAPAIGRYRGDSVPEVGRLEAHECNRQKGAGGHREDPAGAAQALHVGARAHHEQRRGAGPADVLEVEEEADGRRGGSRSPEADAVFERRRSRSRPGRRPRCGRALGPGHRDRSRERRTGDHERREPGRLTDVVVGEPDADHRQRQGHRHLAHLESTGKQHGTDAQQRDGGDGDDRHPAEQAADEHGHAREDAEQDQREPALACRRKPDNRGGQDPDRESQATGRIVERGHNPGGQRVGGPERSVDPLPCESGRPVRARVCGWGHGGARRGAGPTLRASRARCPMAKTSAFQAEDAGSIPAARSTRSAQPSTSRRIHSPRNGSLISAKPPSRAISSSRSSASSAFCTVEGPGSAKRLR